MSEDRVPFGTHDPAAAMVNGRTDTPAGDAEARARTWAEDSKHRQAAATLAKRLAATAAEAEEDDGEWSWMQLAYTALAYAAEAVAAERERCAKVADGYHEGLRTFGPLGSASVNTARMIATAIREQAK